MRTLYIIILIILSGSISMHAQTFFDGKVEVRDRIVQTDEQRNELTVSMKILHRYSDLKSNSWVTLMPMIVCGTDTIALKPVVIYGRLAYYDYIRNNKVEFRKGGAMRYMSKSAQYQIDYSDVVPYLSKMKKEPVQLIMLEKQEWCCNYPEKSRQVSLYVEMPKITYEPQFVYVSPQAEVIKSRSISASAYVNFPAGERSLNPYYSNNRQELEKINTTIDSVRSDKDVTVGSLFIKGYASPEGPYATNAALSKARTESMKNYFLSIAPQLQGVITSEYVAENWDDLRTFVENSDISHKEEILTVINSQREPDNKEWVLKSRYKTEYRYLLDECYPLLRRTDYKVDYTIRSYTDPQEIVEVMKESPHKLSLQEFYLASQVFEPGSDEFNEAFDIAVRMFPSDHAANINAANAAMQKGDMAAAERYLEKAGDSPEADYARGVWCAINADYMRAKGYFSLTADSIPQAREALAVVEYCIEIEIP